MRPKALRLTTRLMQLASWLLLHRAVKEGEMTLTQANREKTKVKLSAADPGTNDMIEKLPQQLAGPDRPFDGAANQSPPPRYQHSRPGDGTRGHRQSAGAAAQSSEGGVRAITLFSFRNRHCEERSDEAIQSSFRYHGLLREPVIGRAFARPVGSHDESTKRAQ